MDAFKDGRFSVHALPFTVQTEMLQPEVLVRGLTYSANLMKSIRRPYPTAAKMTDVPEHSWIMPTLLKNAGVNFLHLGCNPASAIPQVPLLYWWQGPDGSKLLTMYTPLYGSTLLPPADWHHKTWLAMIMRGDNAGPPKPEEVRQMLDEVHAKMPNVKVVVGRLSDFSDRILKEDLSDLPVVRSDMPDTWIHGVMVDPHNVSLSKKTVPMLFEAGYLHTLLQKEYNKADSAFQRKVNNAYENSLLFYEHTWGGSLYWISHYLPPRGKMGFTDSATWGYGEKWMQLMKAGKFKRNIESWEEHSNYEQTANTLASDLLKEQLTKLANAVNSDIVYNPLPWQREGIPALGYKTFTPTAGNNGKISNDTVLENSYFKIMVSPSNGAVQSIINKKNGVELVAQNSSYKMGQFLYERFSYNEVHQFDSAYIRGNSDWGFAELGKPNMPPDAEMPYLSASPEHCHWERNNANELIMHYQPGAANDKLKFPVTTKIILDKDKNYFDIELTIDKPAEPLPEAGWICLPFSIPHPQFRVGRNGSIIDPVKDINVKGVNRHLYEVGTGVALFDASGRGIGICPLDAPLVSLGEPGVFKYDTSYVPTQPNVFFNLFNNHWSTNYRLWNEGKWTYTFRIWAFDKYDAESSLITPSLEALYPVQYGYQNHGAPQKNLTIASTGIELSRKGISITAFETDPFGNTGTLLRLWEMTGKSGEVTISLPQDLHFKKATPVTLRSEKAGKAIKITKGKFSYNIKAFAPLSFLLE